MSPPRQRLTLLIGLALAACGARSEGQERSTTKIDAFGKGADDDPSKAGDPSGAPSAEPTSTPPDGTTATPQPRPDTVVWGDIGERRYRLFIPGTAANADQKALVVMLHGCDQSASDFATVTGMDAIARREKFAVVYPEQAASKNARGCWNWFSVAEQSRAGDEALFVLDVIDEAAQLTAIDEARVFAAGLSAGAALAVILGSCYPERFKAIGAHSGLAFKAASTAATAAWIMAAGPAYSGDASAEGAKICAGKMLASSAIIIHGDADATVHPAHGSRIYDQFRALADWADDAARNNSVSPNESSVGSDGKSYERVVTKKGDGAIVEHISVQGLAHAWSGGKSGFAYSDPEGPSASEMLWAFFAALP